MIQKITRVALATLTVSLTLASAGQAVLIGVNFDGRGSPTTGAGILAPTDIAGVMPQMNFNNILNADYAPNNPPFNAGQTFTSGVLNDSTGAATAVTFSITANDSWNSGVGTGTPDATLLNGIIKAQSTGGGRLDVVPITISGLLPSTAFKLDIYTMENDGANRPSYSITDGTTTYFQRAQIAGDYAGAFVQGTNTVTGGVGTDPIVNYVEFNGTTSPTGDIAISYAWLGGSDGTGIAGFQVSQVPEPSVMALGMISGLGMLGLLRRRKVS